MTAVTNYLAIVRNVLILTALYYITLVAFLLP